MIIVFCLTNQIRKHSQDVFGMSNGMFLLSMVKNLSDVNYNLSSRHSLATQMVRTVKSFQSVNSNSKIQSCFQHDNIRILVYIVSMHLLDNKPADLKM